MTNNGIKTSQILDAIYEVMAPEWRSHNKAYVRMSYETFTKILRTKQLAMDPRTIRLKWELLGDMDIFLHPNKYSCIIDLEAFRDQNWVKYDLSPLEDDTHTKTHTQIPATSEASE